MVILEINLNSTSRQIRVRFPATCVMRGRCAAFLNMKKLIVLILICAFYSCNGQTKKEKMEIGEIKLNNPPISDTIIKKIDPSRLDLEKQQLFIDASENSIFKQKLRKWNPVSEEQITEQIQNFENQKSDSDIQKRWVTIRKYKNEFYNYDRCDGDDFKMEIIGNALILDGTHEKSFYTIEEIIKDKNQWQIKSNFAPTIDLIIEKTSVENIFTLNFKSPHAELKIFITPFENINKFDLIVNHCPQEKVQEFNRFQDPE